MLPRQRLPNFLSGINKQLNLPDIKRTFKLILRPFYPFSFSLPLLLIRFYLIAHRRRKRGNSHADITAYILSNGVHTDLVLPARNDVFNWNNFVNPVHTLSKDSTAAFVAFGWGDKGF